ncbi:MAG: hypothetical protein JNM68_04665 [Dinghuibacter sp.]|nr:hypothetical protein [Dinghuibacter sp.]
MYALLKSITLLFACTFWVWGSVSAQDKRKNTPPDSAATAQLKTDTAKKTVQPHSPKVALRRSAMVPGWGQIYNKQAWKVPIVYAGLGITAGIFVYNVQWYKRTRFAFNVRASQDVPNYVNIHPRLQGLTADDLSFYRKQFRRDVDYSVLFFIAFWGLNIADAVVFAHLKNFDVSDNLSLNIKAGHSNLANTTGLTLALDIHKKKRMAKQGR